MRFLERNDLPVKEDPVVEKLVQNDPDLWTATYVNQGSFTIALLEAPDVLLTGVAKRAMSLDKHNPRVGRIIARRRAVFNGMVL